MGQLWIEISIPRKYKGGSRGSSRGTRKRGLAEGLCAKDGNRKDGAEEKLDDTVAAVGESEACCDATG